MGNSGRLYDMQVELKHGSVLCARCNTMLNSEGCPKCGYPSACIKLGYGGQRWWYYLDEDLQAFTFNTAVDSLITINREIAKNIFDPSSRTRAVIEARQFVAAWEEFIAEKETLIKVGHFAPSTLYMYVTHYRLYLLPKLEGKDVRFISGADTKAILYDLAGKKDKYQRNVLDTLHSFMGWCKDTKHYIRELPSFPEFKGKPLSQSERRDSLTVEEQDEAFALIPEPHRDVYVFAAEIGCRPAEAGLIRLEDIGRDGVLVIKRTFSRYQPTNRTKEGANRSIALSDLALEIVEKQQIDPETGFPRKEGLLFKNRIGRPAWGPYRPAFLRKLWRDTVGYDYPDLYSGIRTSFSTQLAESGDISEKEWRITSGHASEEAADRYFTRRTSRQKHLVNRRRSKDTQESPQKVVPIKKPDSE